MTGEGGPVLHTSRSLIILGHDGVATQAAQACGDAAAAGPQRFYFRLRHAFEVLLSALLLLVLAPLVAAIALAVLIDIGRPILFRQVRPGRHLRPFTLFKFRTMRVASASGGNVPDSQRISAVGLFLRRSRLDELPQLLNVLCGDMSFIGPRPLLPRDLPDGPAAVERATLRPGITGWAQVNGGHQLSSAQKMALDRWYAHHGGLAIDGRIVWRTLKMMIAGERVDRIEIERAMAAI